MTIRDSAYSNSDSEYREIYDFLINVDRVNGNLLWDPGRMNWWQFNVHARKEKDDPFFSNNVRIWRDDKNEIAGLCISEYGENDMFVEVLPGYEEIYPALFEWVFSVWGKDKSKIEIDACNCDAGKIALLEAKGFTFASHVENNYTYNLEKCNLDYQLENGFSITTFLETGNYASKVELIRSAFNNNKVTEKNIRSLIASPDYNKNFDLTVSAPDKRLAAYCTGWVDTSKPGWGSIEPVGTHKEFRQKGLAKALLKECFKRLRSKGVTYVTIASGAEPAVSNFLYESLGPEEKVEVYKYAVETER